MHVIGIDIGKGMHAMAALDECGRLVMEPEMFPQTASGFEALSARLESLGGPKGIRVGMEATGRYWIPLRHSLAGLGYRVEVVNPLLTAHEIATDVRGRKSDRTDAAAIAAALQRDRHSPAPAEDPVGDPLRGLTRHRTFLVRQRSDAKRRIHASLDVLFPEAQAAFGNLFAAGTMALLKRFPSARLLAQANTRTIASLLSAASRRRCPPEKARELRDAARRSVCATLRNEGEEAALVSTLELIGFLGGQIGEAEKRIKTMDAPPAAVVLESVRGVGPLLSRTIAAEYGDLSRFADPSKKQPVSGMSRRMLAFAGCEPRVPGSGNWKGRARISKRGSPSLRTALWQAASMCRLHNPIFQAMYERQCARNKHHTVAIFHLVRKLLEIWCGMYKSNTLFNPQATAQPHVHNSSKNTLQR